MKRQWVIIAAAVAVLAFLAAAATGEERACLSIHELGLGDGGTLKIRGYGTAAFIEGAEPDELGLYTRAFASMERGRWELAGRFDILESSRVNDDWLRFMYLTRDLDKDGNWKLGLGRLYTAVGYTTPPFYRLETVEYPFADHFSAFAWGVGLCGEWGNGWQVEADLTGKSGVPFDFDECWNRLEFCGRLKKSFNMWSLGFSVQLSEDFRRFALDGRWEPCGKFGLRAAGYYVRNTAEDASDSVSGYVIGMYRPVPWLELHSQLDNNDDLSKTFYARNEEGRTVRMESPNSNDTVWTNSIGLLPGKSQRLAVVIDRETVLSGERDGRWLALVQVAF